MINGIEIYFIDDAKTHLFIPLRTYMRICLGVFRHFHCGGQSLNLCVELKIQFFNNNVSEEKKAWGKAP